MERRSDKIIKIGSAIIFAIYLVCLIYFLIFSEYYDRTLSGRSYHYNLILFKEITRFWENRELLGYYTVFLNLVGNVAGFIPFGLIPPILSKKYRSVLKMALLSFEFSLAVEILQLVLKVGCFDVDDMFLNTIGGILGYLIFSIAYFYRRKKYGRNTKKKA